LDGAYTVFGETISGKEVVSKIQRGDVISKVTITEK
ncbi:MAG: peptidylprolyl isomerase, partial [Deltaproteobacteria bacterium]|nr:peptidylprolyl isomerase [Deltaproteobacteria bacterium]